MSGPLSLPRSTTCSTSRADLRHSTYQASLLAPEEQSDDREKTPLTVRQGIWGPLATKRRTSRPWLPIRLTARRRPFSGHALDSRHGFGGLVREVRPTFPDLFNDVTLAPHFIHRFERGAAVREAARAVMEAMAGSFSQSRNPALPRGRPSLSLRSMRGRRGALLRRASSRRSRSGVPGTDGRQILRRSSLLRTHATRRTIRPEERRRSHPARRAGAARVAAPQDCPRGRVHPSQLARCLRAQRDHVRRALCSLPAVLISSPGRSSRPSRARGRADSTRWLRPGTARGASLTRAFTRPTRSFTAPSLPGIV
jgi:hypothetical protein